MRKFELSQKDESRAQSADSSKAYRKPRAFICLQQILRSFGQIQKVHLLCWPQKNHTSFREFAEVQRGRPPVTGRQVVFLLRSLCPCQQHELRLSRCVGITQKLFVVDRISVVLRQACGWFRYK